MIPQVLTDVFEQLPALHGKERIEVLRQLGWMLQQGVDLGSFETLFEIMASIWGETSFQGLEKTSWNIIFSDHGITNHWPDAGTPTTQILESFLTHSSPTLQYGTTLGLEPTLLDVGVAAARFKKEQKELTSFKLRRGSGDFSEVPSLSEDEAEDLVSKGIEYAQKLPPCSTCLLSSYARGSELSSVALLKSLSSSLTTLELLVRPDGFDDIAFNDARRCIEQALEKHRSCLSNPFSSLAALGGFEHAFMVGMIAGCVARKNFIIIEGTAPKAAALWLLHLKKEIAPFLLFLDERFLSSFEITTYNPCFFSSQMSQIKGVGGLLALRILRDLRTLYTSSSKDPQYLEYLEQERHVNFEVDIGNIERSNGERVINKKESR